MKLLATMNSWWRKVILSSVLFVATPTNAQEVDPEVKAKAQALYDEGKRLMDEKNFAAACPKLEEVTQLLPYGVGARLVLGECYASRKELARAYTQYNVAESNALRVGKSDIAQHARAASDKLRPQLILVTLHLEPEVTTIADLTITWDGVNRDRMWWARPMPLDLGKHVIEVSAPSRYTWSREFQFDKGNETLEVRVPMLESLPAAVSPPLLDVAPVHVPSPPLRVPSSLAQPKTSSTWMRPVGLAALGLGAAGMVVGGVLGDEAISKLNASNTVGGCNAQGFCKPLGLELREEMVDFADGSTIGWIVGGASAGIGAILLITGRSEKRESKRANMNWQVQVTSGGIGVGGTW